jgi:hypothetical protein
MTSPSHNHPPMSMSSQSRRAVGAFNVVAGALH